MPAASGRRPATRAGWRRREGEAAFFRAAPTTRSKPSETILTSAPSRRQKARNAGKPGSMRTLRICASSCSGVTRSSSTWRCMHSREEIWPDCQAVSTTRHSGSANRSSKRSVGSSGATVPSKSTRTCHLARDGRDIRLLMSVGVLCRGGGRFGWAGYTRRAAVATPMLLCTYAPDTYALCRRVVAHRAHANAMPGVNVPLTAVPRQNPAGIVG